MTERKDLTAEIHDDAVLVVVSRGEIDEDWGAELEEQVAAVARQSPSSPVILDLSRVEAIRDDALGALVELLHDCRSRGQRFILSGLQPQALEIMSVTKLGRLFEYREDVEDARAHLKDSG